MSSYTWECIVTTTHSETQGPTETWAIRSLARVAEALTEALGEWAEWGEGDLADGVRELARRRGQASKAQAVHVVTKASLGAAWVSGVYSSQEAAEQAVAADPQAREYQASVKEHPVQP